MRSLSRAALHTVLATLAVATGLRAGAAAPPIDHPAHIPAGVADPAGEVVCVRTPSGGVEAVEAATGARLWESAGPSRPLLFSGGTAYLLEERDVLRVAAVDARSGRALRTWTVPAPEIRGLSEGGQARIATSFRSVARRAGPALEIGYEVERTRITGIGPQREAHHAGMIRVDTRSDRIEVRRGVPFAVAPLVEPGPAAGVRLMRFHARAPDGRLVFGGPPPQVEGLLVSGDHRYGFEWLRDRVRVHHFAPGARAPAAALEILAEADAIWVTLDRRHVALRRASDQRHVDVHRLDGGARVATVSGAADLAVAGGRLYFTTGGERGALVLRCLDLATGGALWERSVQAAESGRLPEPIP